ncbi:MAG: MFS transporter, partial [Firmicutes bacterium]|nr:MFS transporter [Bacillota bacterium]
MSLLGKTDRLDRPAWLLLIINGLFAVSTAMSNTFVNVYLWKLKQDFIVIGRFNLASYLAMAITFVLAGRLAKQLDRVIAIRIGVALQALFYLAVLFFGPRSAELVIPLGFFMGIGSG